MKKLVKPGTEIAAFYKSDDVFCVGSEPRGLFMFQDMIKTLNGNNIIVAKSLTNNETVHVLPTKVVDVDGMPIQRYAAAYNVK